MTSHSDGDATDGNRAAVVTTAGKVRFAQSSALDTGLNPVWSAVADAVATDNDGAVVADTVATVGGGVGNGAVTDTADTNRRSDGR